MAKTILYHGSYGIVQKPNLSLCNMDKDFGQGFYLTTSRSQAEKFVSTSIKKAIARKIVPSSYCRGFINKFEFDNIENLSCHIFQNADASWLHCVAAHRKRGWMHKRRIRKDQWCFKTQRSLDCLKFISSEEV